MLDDFVILSEVLTGVKPLDRALAAEYLQRFRADPDVGPLMGNLISAFKDIVSRGGDIQEAIGIRIMRDATLSPVAQQLIYLWYVSAFFKRDPANPVKGTWQYGRPEHYERALVWSIIRGHAPMTGDVKYGFWAEPPK